VAEVPEPPGALELVVFEEFLEFNGSIRKLSFGDLRKMAPRIAKKALS
jgi:hypothetical protein